MIKTRVACGRWIRLFPGVYAIAGVPSYRLLKDSPLSAGADYQHRVTDDAGFVARLDVGYPARRAGMEACSLRWH